MQSINRSPSSEVERGTGLVSAIFGALVSVTLLLFGLQVSLVLLARSEAQAVLGQTTSDLALPSTLPFQLRRARAVANVRRELGPAGTSAALQLWRTPVAVHGALRLQVPTVLPALVADPLGLAHVDAAVVARRPRDDRNR
jgi:hypothetical protein